LTPRLRLIEIRDAVKDIDPDLLATEPGIPRRDIAGMRDHLAHRYFDTAQSIVQATVEDDLPPLPAAARRLSAQLASSKTRQTSPYERGRRKARHRSSSGNPTCPPHARPGPGRRSSQGVLS
jgi:hypothetical protein